MEKYKEIGIVQSFYEKYYSITFKDFEYLIDKKTMVISKEKKLPARCNCCIEYTATKITKNEEIKVKAMMKEFLSKKKAGK